MAEAGGGKASSFNDQAIGTHDNAPFSPSSDLDPGTSESESSALVPPYWQPPRHDSRASVQSQRSIPIQLLDHTSESHEHNKAVWAKGATINDYILISGTIVGVGDYVVWNCKIDTLDVSEHLLLRTLSESMFPSYQANLDWDVAKCSGWRYTDKEAVSRHYLDLYS